MYVGPTPDEKALELIKMFQDISVMVWNPDTTKEPKFLVNTLTTGSTIKVVLQYVAAMITFCSSDDVSKQLQNIEQNKDYWILVERSVIKIRDKR